MVDIKALIGERRVTERQAAANLKFGAYPRRPRPAHPGLVDLDATGVWDAIKHRGFPAPVRGPKGLQWSLDAVLRWKQTHQ